MSDPARRLPSFDELYAEIEALAPGMTGEILAPGELRVMGRPGRKHRVVARRLLAGLRGSDVDEGGDGWCFEVEAEIRFGPRMFVPDLAGWRVRLGDPYPPSFLDVNPIEQIPDCACEIVSRSTQRGDRALKLPVYAASGVGHVWVVDPEARTIEVYEAVEGRSTLVATAREADRAELPPFTGPLDVGQLWRPGATAAAPTPR